MCLLRLVLACALHSPASPIVALFDTVLLEVYHGVHTKQRVFPTTTTVVVSYHSLYDTINTTTTVVCCSRVNHDNPVLCRVSSNCCFSVRVRGSIFWPITLGGVGGGSRREGGRFLSIVSNATARTTDCSNNHANRVVLLFSSFCVFPLIARCFRWATITCSSPSARWDKRSSCHRGAS